MYQFTINLLIRFTGCSWVTNGKKISLEWIWNQNSLRWISFAPKGKRIVIVNNRKIRIEKSDLNRLIEDLKSKKYEHQRKG